MLCIPRFLSRVRVNWFSAGGTLRRCLRIRRWRWMRTTLGHLTNRCRSFLGGSAPPIPNCFGLFSKSGLVIFSCTKPNTTKSVHNIQQWHLTHLEKERGGAQHILFSSWPAPAPCHLASGPADLIQGLSTLHQSYTDFSKISSGNIMPPRSTKPD